MQNRILFTKDSLEALLVLDKQQDYLDTKTPCFQIRVYASGRKTYFLYRKIKGYPQRIKIGGFLELTLEQARKEANRLNSVITLGGNPAKDRDAERAELTIKELCDRYHQDHAVHHTKRPEDNKRTLERHIIPIIGNKKLSDITPDKIRQLHVQIGETKGQITANRVMAMTSAVFNFGIKYGYHKLANPCYGLTRYRQYSRDRFLSKEELKKFFLALKSEKQLYQDYFSLLLFTGARKSNVLAMRWDDIDFDLCRWRIDAAKAKNKEVNIVYLSDHSLKILQRRKEENEGLASLCPYVFPGDGLVGHLHDPKKAFQRVRKEMGVADIRIHDLRRTLASYMAISGTSLPIIGAALNHKSQASTAIYARLAQAPVLDAINKAVSSFLD